MKWLKKAVRDQLLLRGAPPLFKAWMTSISREIYLPPELGDLSYLSKAPCFVAGWHDTMLAPISKMAPLGFHFLVSHSKEGNVIARAVEALGAQTIRGSSTRGGAEAMQEIAERAISRHPFRLAISVDGPRGPKHHAKFGVIQMSRRTQIPILPFGVAVDRAWRLRSWDRLVLPKPGARAIITSTGLLRIPADFDEQEGEHWRVTLENAIKASENLAQAILEAKSSKALPSKDLAKAA